MIKHTVAHLGPAVSANRMVAEYVQRLYQPAAEAGRLARADGYAATKELASWVERVRPAWSGVGIEHVESHGLADEPQIGESLQVRAHVNLGELRPEDVSVTVVYGTVDESDELSKTATQFLDDVVEDGHGRYQFSTDLVIDRSGSFGYGVHVLPRHQALANPAELGLITTA